MGLDSQLTLGRIAPMGNEEWREAFPGFYEVSSLGRVRSIDRLVKTSHYPEGRKYSGKVMSTYINDNGYEIVSLCFGSHRKKVRVHILVAEAFLEPRPSSLHEVNHKDFNRSNNAAQNLEWATRSENLGHSARAGRMRREGFKGENNHQSKLKVSDIREIRLRRLAGEPVASIASSLGVHFSTVYLVLQGKTWTQTS